jgi:uncharacterized protein YeaO (DUF488 family)
VKIGTKRVNEPAGPGDGLRFLVERLWPRGVRKDALPLAGWVKEAAPSTDLRKWFHHDPERWEEFQDRYRAELKTRPEAWKPLLNAAREGTITLLYSTHDREHNSALVLQVFLQEHAASSRPAVR